MSSVKSSIVAAAVVTLLFSLLGCGPPEVDATYGKRRGSPGGDSVNGTAVLANMFETAGHRVTTWRRLSPKLEDADVIVWFPAGFTLPKPAERQYLESWLARKPGRTVIYVGRDYDASIRYWHYARTVAPPIQAIEVARRAAVARAVHDEQRSKLPKKESCDWFVLDSDQPHRTVTTLNGPWARGIDEKKVEIEIDARFQSPTATDLAQWQSRDWNYVRDVPAIEQLLASGDDLLVTKLSTTGWRGSQLLLVTNGSFLLNLPLVNHEHRKLAAKLISSCGPAGRVMFLESGDEDLEIFDNEPGTNAPTGFEVFTVWPIGVILIHLTALGMLACFALYPVFGRPQELPAAATGDFGQHITALGELLETTGDHEYARARLRQYAESLKHDTKSGRRGRR